MDPDVTALAYSSSTQKARRINQSDVREILPQRTRAWANPTEKKRETKTIKKFEMVATEPYIKCAVCYLIKKLEQSHTHARKNLTVPNLLLNQL